MKQKNLFIASSSKFLVYPYVFKDSLNTTLKSLSLDYIQCVLWKDDGVFKQGHGYLETLTNLTPNYAVALVTPDDTAIIRGQQYIVPRDNVTFEYGLFLGKLGRDRTFLVTPENTPDLQIMSDLHGVETIRYQFSPDADINQAKHDLLSAVYGISILIYQMENPRGEAEVPLDSSEPNPPIKPKVIFSDTHFPDL